jgi:iron complex outermembrane receptor protein
LENKASRNQHALFLSTGLLAVKGLRIFPSARYDHFSDINKNVVTYKIGFNYQPFEEINLSIKTNAGKNFRAPTFNDLYWKESGNKNLKPETAYNAEAGLIYLFDFISQGQIEFTYTHISAKDKIVWTPQRNLIWTPLNIAKSESNNFLINFSFAKDFADQLSVKFESGINFVNSVKTSESYSNDPTKDKNFPYIPLQTIKLGFMLEYQFFWLNLFYTHIGKRYSDFENKNSLNPYNILDGNISFNTEISGIDSELKLEVNNLTDTEYETISGYPMPLRNFIITLSLKY